MSRVLSLGAVVFACLSLSVTRAQNKPDEPAFPFSKRTFGGITLARPGPLARSFVRRE